MADRVNFLWRICDRDNFLWRIYAGSSRQGTNDQIMPRIVGERFPNTFSSNLTTVNLNIFPDYGGIYTSGKSPD